MVYTFVYKDPGGLYEDITKHFLSDKIRVHSFRAYDRETGKHLKSRIITHVVTHIENYQRPYYIYSIENFIGCFCGEVDITLDRDHNLVPYRLLKHKIPPKLNGMNIWDVDEEHERLLREDLEIAEATGMG